MLDTAVALTGIASALRSRRYRGDVVHPDRATSALFRLAAGMTCEPDTIKAAIGDDVLAALRSRGEIEVDPDDPSMLRLAMVLYPLGSIITALPRPQPGLDHVYLGPDSLQLLDHVWRRAGRGERAVDLACGNGFIGAAMSTRYRHVTAADLSARCVEAARWITVLNPVLAGRFDVIQTDVTEGLENGSFDLVTANPPWVPDRPSRVDRPNNVFANGGPTGFELPRRFFDAIPPLLTARGVAYVGCMDLTFADGRRPLLDHSRVMEANGAIVTVTDSGYGADGSVHRWATKTPDVVAGRHVIAEIRCA